MDSRPQCDRRASAHTLVLLLERQAFDMELEAPKMHRVLPTPSELTPARPPLASGPKVATTVRPRGLPGSGRITEKPRYASWSH